MDWAQRSHKLDRAIRAFNPFPCLLHHLQGQRVKVWQAKPPARRRLAEACGTIFAADRKWHSGQLWRRVTEHPAPAIAREASH